MHVRSRYAAGRGSEPFPLTDLQSAYLVGSSPLIELGGFSPSYYVELEVADLDTVRATEALRRLVLRHEHLRTMVLADGRQQVLDEAEAPVSLPVVDLSGLSAQEQETIIGQTRERMCDQGVDPAHWPLFEVVVHPLGHRRARVHISMSLLLLDGHGIRQVVSDFSELYRDPAAALPPVVVTYRQCRQSLLADEETDSYRKQWRYWEDRLDTLPEAPRLPLASQLAGIGPARFTRRACHLTGTEWKQLQTSFRKHRIMTTTALLHVFAETLGAWSENPAYCLNVLHQNWAAKHPEWAGVVGQLGNTLPLEVDLRQGEDFWTRGQRLQSQLWRDLQQSDVTGVKITRELAARRGWTSRAAFPYVFTSMLGPGGSGRPQQQEQAGPSCRMVTSELRTPQVLIDNQIQDGAQGGITCVWDVVDAAFPPGLPDAMFGAYRNLLQTLARPDGAAARPDPVPAGHRAVVARLNAPVSAQATGRLEDGFLRQASARPGAPAVVTSQRTLTYGELETTSRAVAAWLRGQGIGPGDIVPVVMAKGWEQVAAVLGVLRSGAAYCPVDAGLPGERISHLLDECGARAVLRQSHARPPATAGDGLAALDVDQVQPAGDQIPAAEGTSADLAYIIYTSGSTGQPKGVMIEHRAALNTIEDVNERVGLTAADRVFAISSLSFDLSVWDIFGTLGAGAALVIPDATQRPDPIGWADAVTSHGVTIWNSVPALAEMLVEVAAQRPRAGLPPMRAFLLSGDWVPLTLPDRMRTLWPDVRILAMGGATEASIWSNLFEVGQVDPGWRSIPYGSPLRNQTMTVLDHQLTVRAPWATGRIYIGGDGLARGYFRDEQRTAERFVTHPGTGERLYWTGDLGRYWPDGTIEFLGREDRQVKIQGFRIEPGEVETAIRTHPQVKDCVACAVDGAGGQRRLLAFAIPHDGQTVGEQEIRAHLRRRVPHYMIPGEILLTSHLPLTPNGKVDIAAAEAMRASVQPGPEPGPGLATADTVTMKRLQELWAEILQLPVVDPDADFFALGGTSILALRLVNRIMEDFGTDLSFGKIFEAPTVRALAGCIEHSDGVRACDVVLRGGDGQELVLFHPVGGAVTCYVDLARCWPGPVRAFQSPALAGTRDQPPGRGLEAMAAGYVKAIQHRSPDGPYLLGGWSMGGVLAYEAARQLAAQGHQCRVFMIDSDIRNTRLPATEAARHLEFLSDLAGGYLPPAVTAAVAAAAPDGLAAAARSAAVSAGLLPDELDAGGYRRLMRVHADNLAVLADYRPGESGVPALLLVAGQVSRPDPVPAWRAVCPRLETDVWPCDHYSIMSSTRISAIAERVRGWLADC